MLNSNSVIYAIAITCPVVIITHLLNRLITNTPKLLHEKKPAHQICKRNLIGHRGSKADGLPENTLASFKDASKHAQIVELDVWLTKDNQIIIHHDETFDRMTNGSCKAKMCDLNHSELPSLIPPIDQNERLHEYSNFDVTTVPTLEQVLQSIPEHTHLIIEFKQESDILIKAVHDLLIKYDRLREHKDYWFSLKEKINEKLYKYDPTIPRITSVIGMMKLLIYYSVGLLPFMDIKESAVGITIASIGLKEVQGWSRHVPALANVPEFVFKFIAYFFRTDAPSGIGPPAIFLQSTLFTHLRKRGIPIILMGINDEESLLLAINSGATCILSDKIRVIKEYLDTHPELQFASVESNDVNT